MKKVLQFWGKNTEEFPGSARSFFELGEACHQCEDKEGAIAAYKATLNIDPGHEQARKALADMECLNNS